MSNKKRDSLNKNPNDTYSTYEKFSIFCFISMLVLATGGLIYSGFTGGLVSSTETTAQSGKPMQISNIKEVTEDGNVILEDSNGNEVEYTLDELMNLSEEEMAELLEFSPVEEDSVEPIEGESLDTSTEDVLTPTPSVEPVKIDVQEETVEQNMIEPNTSTDSVLNSLEIIPNEEVQVQVEEVTKDEE